MAWREAWRWLAGNVVLPAIGQQLTAEFELSVERAKAAQKSWRTATGWVRGADLRQLTLDGWPEGADCGVPLETLTAAQESIQRAEMGRDMVSWLGRPVKHCGCTACEQECEDMARYDQDARNRPGLRWERLRGGGRQFRCVAENADEQPEQGLGEVQRLSMMDTRCVMLCPGLGRYFGYTGTHFESQRGVG